MSIGDVHGATVEMIPQGIEIGLRDGAKVRAFGVSPTDQSVELFHAALVASSIRPGEKHGIWTTQRCSHRGVSGKLAAVV